MSDSNGEQKQRRLKQFLKNLSKDPSLVNQARAEDNRCLSDLLLITGYKLRNEPINIAELISLLLRKNGLQAGSEDMMEYVMNGGTVDEFMSIQK